MNPNATSNTLVTTPIEDTNFSVLAFINGLVVDVFTLAMNPSDLDQEPSESEKLEDDTEIGTLGRYLPSHKMTRCIWIKLMSMDKMISVQRTYLMEVSKKPEEYIKANRRLRLLCTMESVLKALLIMFVESIFPDVAGRPFTIVKGWKVVVKNPMYEHLQDVESMYKETEQTQPSEVPDSFQSC